MYDRTVQIPAAGESTSFPALEGIGFQVVRMEFDGFEDPIGNPVIRDRNGRVRTRMQTGDPIRSDFDGLEVRNDNANAAGTKCILRIYEEGDEISHVPRPKQRVDLPDAFDVLTDLDYDSAGKLFVKPGRQAVYRFGTLTLNGGSQHQEYLATPVEGGVFSEFRVRVKKNGGGVPSVDIRLRHEGTDKNGTTKPVGFPTFTRTSDNPNLYEWDYPRLAGVTHQYEESVICVFDETNNEPAEIDWKLGMVYR